MTHKPSTIRSKSMKNSIPNKGNPQSIQTTDREEPTRPPRTARRLGSAPHQTTFQQNRKNLGTKMKDKYDIARLLLEKMPEIDKQL